MDNLSVAISRMRKVAEAINNKDPTYDHLEKSDVETLEKEIQAATLWFENTWGVLKASKKTEKCPITVTEIYSKAEAFQKATLPIATKPKPKVEPPKEEKKEDKKDKNSQKKRPNKQKGKRWKTA